jgi:hypothetical protein
MKISTAYMEEMRRRAREHLSPTFARNVIQAAAHQRRACLQLRIAAVTAVVCIVTAISVHWVRTEFTERRNLEAWNRAAAQIRVLEESI